MNETMMDWDDLRLFLSVARAGGLSAAAEETGKSPPTLGRRMLALEEKTGNELFLRLPRGYDLTQQGRALFDKVVELESRIIQLDRSTEHSGQPLVKVSAGSWMTCFLCRHVQQLVTDNSALRIRFISAEAVMDISRRETTIGIRNQRPTQANLVCRKIGRVQFAGYAVNKRVRQWVLVKSETPSAQWLTQQLEAEAKLEVTSARNALDLAQGGVARALLPTFIGDNTRGLRRVTSPINDLAHDQWLVTHQEDRHRPEVRHVIDSIYKIVRASTARKVSN